MLFFPQLGATLCRDAAIRYAFRVTILGPLAGEPPEPMTKEQFEGARKRVRATLNGVATIDKRDLERLINEVIWLKRRLHRVEEAIAPLVAELRRYI
jgi:hypothetical protein